MAAGPERGVKRALSTLLSMTESRVGLASLGVILCVTLTLGVSLRWLFHDALPGQQGWSTRNSNASYPERTFPSDELIGSAKVVEDARLWMPRNSSYRLVIGENKKYSPWAWAAPNFLAGFLLPRRRDDSLSTTWIFCLGCDVPALGVGFEVLSDSGNGVVFGRSRS